MTTTSIVIVAGIVAAFLLFGGVLAWGDFYSRNRGKTASKPDQKPVANDEGASEHRKAA